MMEISFENLFILLKNAINDGDRDELLEFLCNSADEQYLDVVINKIGDYIKDILSTKLDSSQSKITQILNIILGLAEIASFGPEKSECLTRWLLSIAGDESCSIYNLTIALTMVKSFLSDDHIMGWCSSDESLFVPLKLLGVKLTGIGDYECQYTLLEILWRISETDKNFWTDMWFSNLKTKSLFLNLNADHFILDSRKFLNCVNRNEVNRRTYAFVATSVSLGSIQLKKPFGSDFWIDFNYDSESISFCCSNLVVENDKNWETINIPSHMVEGYCIQNKKSLKTKELCVTLNCSCSQLLSSEDISIDGLESQLFRVSFWSFLDIRPHIEVIFKKISSDAVENVSYSQHMKQKRRASESIDLVCSNENQETVASSQNYNHRRASESTELVCPSYPQEMNANSHNRKQRRVSESSTLVTAVDLQQYDVNNIETDAHVPDYNIRKRKYTHSKKVSDGYVDSEELNQDVHLATDCMEEEIIESQSCSNAMDNRRNQNDNIYENEHDVEPYGNDNDGADFKKKMSLSKSQSQKHIEINTPFKSKRKSSQVSVDGCLQSTSKRSQNVELLDVSNLSKRKSSQVSVDGCLQSTPKRSQNSELLEVSNLSIRKSSQVSVDRLQSTPKRSQNAKLPTVSNMSKRKSPQLSPIIAINTIQVQRNVSPERVENNSQLEEEKRNDFEIEAEIQDYQASNDMECDINLQSTKNKGVLDKKNKHKIARGENSVGPVEAEEKENDLISGPQKTHRRAAVNARKRNKLILEQKGSETSFEGNQQNKSDVLSDKIEDELQNNASKSVKRSKSTKSAKANSGKIDDDHDEYAFCTPPPLVKRRNHKRSIFITDTETGSSEVSWLSKFKLFETPKKSYSNRKKINKPNYQKKHAKPKLQRAKKSFKTRQLSSQRSKTSDSESRSKTAFSELERFSLVIEKDHKVLPANDLSGLYHTLDYNRDLRQSSIEDNVQQDYSNELDVANENENSVELNGNNEIDVSENEASNSRSKQLQKRKYKMFAPSTSVEVPDVMNESNILSKNKKNIKSIRSLGKNKVPPKQFSRGKKRLLGTTTVKYNDKTDKNVENLVSSDLDSITVSENRPKRIKKNSYQGSEKNASNSNTKSQSTSNKTPNLFPISLETVVEVSPFKRDKGTSSGRWISPNKILENSNERRNLESKKTLTEERLSSYNDEKQGKKMHLDHYFESISSVSPNPHILDITEVTELSTTLDKSKRKHNNSISGENTVKDNLSKSEQQSPQHHYSDHTQKEYNIANPSLTNKSLHNSEEEEHSEKQISNIESSESPFQEPLPKFQKTPTTDKMSCEDNLPTKPSVLHILSNEVGTLTHRLFLTLKKCMSDFREKMVALRVSIVNTADSMISNESKFTEKDLGSLAKSCRESRIHIQKHLRKLYAIGIEYFESEKILERRLAKKHKKAVLKYTKRLQMAQSIADKALEDRFILKSRAFLKSFLKKMELV